MADSRHRTETARGEDEDYELLYSRGQPPGKSQKPPDKPPEERPVPKGYTFHYSTLFSEDCPLAKQVVEEIERRLVSIGVTKSFLGHFSVPLGHLVLSSLLEAASTSEFVICILTPDSREDNILNFLRESALLETLDREYKGRFIPVVVGNTEVPGDLAVLSCLHFAQDWRRDENSWQKLTRIFNQDDSPFPDPLCSKMDDVHFRTHVLGDKISNLHGTFVETESFGQVRQLLKKKKTAVLCGAPGEGCYCRGTWRICTLLDEPGKPPGSEIGQEQSPTDTQETWTRSL